MYALEVVFAACRGIAVFTPTLVLLAFMWDICMVVGTQRDQQRCDPMHLLMHRLRPKIALV